MAGISQSEREILYKRVLHLLGAPLRSIEIEEEQFNKTETKIQKKNSIIGYLESRYKEDKNLFKKFDNDIDNFIESIYKELNI